MRERGWLLAAALAGAVVIWVLWSRQHTDVAATKPAGTCVPATGAEARPGLPGSTPTTYEASLKESRATGKPLLLFFTKKDCDYCLRMKQDIIPHADVQRALSQYIFCVVDCDQEPSAVQKFGVAVLPTFIIVEGSEHVRKRDTGYMPVNQFTKWLGSPAAQAAPAQPRPPAPPPMQQQQQQQQQGTPPPPQQMPRRRFLPPRGS